MNETDDWGDMGQGDVAGEGIVGPGEAAGNLAGGGAVSLADAGLVEGVAARPGPGAEPLGFPSHITLLYPFLPSGKLDTHVDENLALLAASTPPFEFELAGVCGFPGVIWLAPEPADVFTTRVRQRLCPRPTVPDRLGCSGRTKRMC